MPKAADAPTGVRARTRRAILDAAMQILSRKPGASIHEIADAAGVGRSTVHRYFEDRAALIEALALHVYTLSDAGIARADLTSGPPLPAVRRLAEEQLELGLALDFVLKEKTYRSKPELFTQFASGDEAVAEALFAASHSDGRFPEGWDIKVFWALLRLSAEFADEGLPRHQVLDALMQTLERGILKPAD